MHEKIIDEFYDKYNADGYINENALLNHLIERNLSFDEIDNVCSTLLAKNVIFKDENKEGKVDVI